MAKHRQNSELREENSDNHSTILRTSTTNGSKYFNLEVSILKISKGIVQRLVFLLRYVDIEEPVVMPVTDSRKYLDICPNFRKLSTESYRKPFAFELNEEILSKNVGIFLFVVNPLPPLYRPQ